VQAGRRFPSNDPVLVRELLLPPRWSGPSPPDGLPGLCQSEVKCYKYMSGLDFIVE
jgi:hypothetical protein